MTTKKLLSLAIIAALPFNAWADWTTNERTYHTVNTPAQVASNGTVTIANNGPYAIATIGDDDDEHIASTAYVKGAYNDSIAAVNRLDIEKQPALFNGTTGDRINDVDGADDFLYGLAYYNDESAEVMEQRLISSNAVVAGIKSQRVTIYTTWDDDRSSATTVVPLTTVVPED